MTLAMVPVPSMVPPCRVTAGVTGVEVLAWTNLPPLTLMPVLALMDPPLPTLTVPLLTVVWPL